MQIKSVGGISDDKIIYGKPFAPKGRFAINNRPSVCRRLTKKTMYIIIFYLEEEKRGNSVKNRAINNIGTAFRSPFIK